MNRDRILNAALASIDDNQKSLPNESQLHSRALITYQEMLEWLEVNHKKGMLTPHDVTVGTEIGRVMSGGECPGWNQFFLNKKFLDAERSSFIRLAQTQETQARIVCHAR